MAGLSRARGMLPAVVAVALVVSGALLGLGVVVERTTATAGPSAAHGVSIPTGHSEAAEQGTTGPDALAQTLTLADPDHGHEQTPLGTPIDALLPVGAVMVVSLGLAALVWWRPTRSTTSRRWRAAAAGATLVAACGVCCVAPPLVLLGGVAVSSLAAAILIPALALLAVIAAGAGLWLMRRRHRAGGGTCAPRVVDLGLPAVAPAASSVPSTGVRR